MLYRGQRLAGRRTFGGCVCVCVQMPIDLDLGISVTRFVLCVHVIMVCVQMLAHV